MNQMNIVSIIYSYVYPSYFTYIRKQIGNYWL